MRLYKELIKEEKRKGKEKKRSKRQRRKGKTYPFE